MIFSQAIINVEKFQYRPSLMYGHAQVYLKYGKIPCVIHGVDLSQGSYVIHGTDVCHVLYMGLF